LAAHPAFLHRSQSAQCCLADLVQPGYTAWAALTGNNTYTLTNWGTSNQMTFYVRKDIVSKLWPYGTIPQSIAPPVDPYAGITSPVTRIMWSVDSGRMPASSSRRAVLPWRQMAVYMWADAGNNRIQHLSPAGKVLQAWGTFADISKRRGSGRNVQRAVGGGCCSGWQRIRDRHLELPHPKVHPRWEFLQMWGTGPAEGNTQFYGPRGLAVDSLGHVFVADTGNKRIVIFDANGKYLGEFGGPARSLANWTNRWILPWTHRAMPT